MCFKIGFPTKIHVTLSFLDLLPSVERVKIRLAFIRVLIIRRFVKKLIWCSNAALY